MIPDCPGGALARPPLDAHQALCPEIVSTSTEFVASGPSGLALMFTLVTALVMLAAFVLLALTHRDPASASAPPWLGGSGIGSGGGGTGETRDVGGAGDTRRSGAAYRWMVIEDLDGDAAAVSRARAGRG